MDWDSLGIGAAGAPSAQMAADGGGLGAVWEQAPLTPGSGSTARLRFDLCAAAKRRREDRNLVRPWSARNRERSHITITHELSRPHRPSTGKTLAARHVAVLIPDLELATQFIRRRLFGVRSDDDAEDRPPLVEFGPLKPTA